MIPHARQHSLPKGVLRWSYCPQGWCDLAVHGAERPLGDLCVKRAHIPLYTGDWLTDPQLSICSPATRGIWIDFICAMHQNGRSGIISGTNEQLSRLARCSSPEIEKALKELSRTDAADVSSKDGIWTIANRRMKREAATREIRKEAGSIGGSKTQAKREANPYQNFSYPPPSPSRPLSPPPHTPPPLTPPQPQSPPIPTKSSCTNFSLVPVPVPELDLEQARQKVRDFGAKIGVNEEDSDWFFFHCEGNGWTNRGQPIRDWKATLRTWFFAKYLPSQKQFFGRPLNQMTQMTKYGMPLPKGCSISRNGDVLDYTGRVMDINQVRNAQ